MKSDHVQGTVPADNKRCWLTQPGDESNSETLCWECSEFAVGTDEADRTSKGANGMCASDSDDLVVDCSD